MTRDEQAIPLRRRLTAGEHWAITWQQMAAEDHRAYERHRDAGHAKSAVAFSDLRAWSFIEQWRHRFGDCEVSE